MDVLIDRLRTSRFGCRLAVEFFGCIVYADDVLLLSHLVEALRYMLTICENFTLPVALLNICTRQKINYHSQVQQ